MFGALGDEQLDGGMVDVEHDLDLAGLDLGEQEVEHDDPVRGSHVEAAGGRPGAETLDDAPVRADLDGVGFVSSVMVMLLSVRCGQPRRYLATASGDRDDEDGGRPDERAGDVVRGRMAELDL